LRFRKCPQWVENGHSVAYHHSMSGGYREAPEEGHRRRQEWLAVAVFASVMFAGLMAVDHWADAVIAATVLSTFAYRLVAGFMVAFASWALLRLLGLLKSNTTAGH
jgi:hypothetical protein